MFGRGSNQDSSGTPGAHWGGGQDNTATNETSLIQSGLSDDDFWNAYESGTSGDDSWQNDGDPTNDLGNAGYGFTSFSDLFDGGGPGQSGDSYTGGIWGNQTVGDTSQGVSSIVSGSGDSDSGSDSSGDSKIVCTAMNEDYGFGTYRQAIWLKYSKDHLTKAHEVGYHAMFLPLLAIRKKWYGKPIYSLLKHIARHRTADLRAEMQGKKRDRIGQAWRFVLEPLVYTIGRIKGAK